MADADDFDVEELRALLRGETSPPARAEAGGRPAVKKAPAPSATATTTPGKGSGRAATRKAPGGQTAPAAKRGKR